MASAGLSIVALSDNAIRLPFFESNILHAEAVFNDINAAGAGGRHSVLFFKYLVETRNIRVVFFLNEQVIVGREFEFSGVEEAPRSFHEIIPPGVLRENNNSLLISVTVSDEDPFGKIVFSDIFFLY
jgi:hypothetical protein